MKRRKNEPKENGIPEYKAQEALAALIRNTRTTSRKLSLLEIEKWLSIAVQRFGSVNAVADRISISTKMLRQFQAIKKLSDPVRQLFAMRRIDSVDAAVYLSKFNCDDQLTVAKELALAHIDTSDLRAIYDLTKQQPKKSLEGIIQNIKETRNIRQYIIEFVVRGCSQEPHVLWGRFARVLGDENIVSLDVEGSIGSLVLNETGGKKLRMICKSDGISKRQAVTQIAEGKVG